MCNESHSVEFYILRDCRKLERQKILVWGEIAGTDSSKSLKITRIF